MVASRFVANNPELNVEDDEVSLQEINENDLLEAREVVDDAINGTDNHESQTYIRKGLSYFTEVIPDCWLEILEKDTPMMYAIM